MFRISQVSPERADALSEEIARNSEPAWRFYALLITASMIACFGLAANSTAVIIGAMLVSPLMTPIFGIALGMLQGDVALMGRAARAEFGGVILAIASAALVGISPLFSGEATPEMLSRTQPNLIDLLVAIFAGFAGAYALIDERISPALPGVAIATAIVPPLSTCGLCISLGAWHAAAGSMLLFLANFVSILLVALLTFGLGGMALSSDAFTWKAWRRRFVPTVIAFGLMAWILTQSLIQITADRRIRKGIHETLMDEFANDLAVELDDFDYDLEQGRVEILVNVRAPRVVVPSRVTKLQETISAEISMPVDLVVRTTLAKDVTAFGSQLHVQQPDINGKFLAEGTEGNAVKESLAAQVIREYFESSSGFELTNLEYGVGSHDQGVVLAYIDALSTPSAEAMADLEGRLEDRLDDEKISLAIRLNRADVETRNGPFMIEFEDWRNAPAEDFLNLTELENEIKLIVSNLIDMKPSQINFQYGEDTIKLLIQVIGPEPVDQSQAKLIEERVSELMRRPVEVYLWFRHEYVVSPKEYTTYDALKKTDLREREEAMQALFGSRP